MSDTSKTRKKPDIVLAALYRGEADARLLDGRDFDARYWQNARRQLTNLKRELAKAEGERDAFAACLESNPSSIQDDGIKHGGRIALLDAQAETALRDVGCPVRCCDYWPECSHVLAWVESNQDSEHEA